MTSITRRKVLAGQSLMEAAAREGVEGIDADCGGVLSCATCHQILASPQLDGLVVEVPPVQK